MDYADAYPDEIEAALAENASFDAEIIRRLFPHAQIIDIDLPSEATDGSASGTG